VYYIKQISDLEQYKSSASPSPGTLGDTATVDLWPIYKSSICLMHYARYPNITFNKSPFFGYLVEFGYLHRGNPFYFQKHSANIQDIHKIVLNNSTVVVYTFMAILFISELHLCEALHPLTAYCLAHTVLIIWSRLRLTDVCYPVVDIPCRNGILPRWNYRPGSAALPFCLCTCSVIAGILKR